MPVIHNIPTQPETINPVVANDDVTREVVHLSVVGHPMPKERPRMAHRRAGGLPRLYNPSLRHERQFASSVRTMMGLSNTSPPFFDATADLHVSLCFRVRRPNGHFIACDRARNLRPDFVCARVSGGDTDNLVKLVLDALNGVLYENDNQVLAISAMKEWASDPNSPGSTTVAIWSL